MMLPAVPRLNQQQLGAIDDDAVRHMLPRREPARRIPGRLQLGTPREAGAPAFRQRSGAPGPPREALHGAQARGPNADAIDQLRKARVARGAPCVRAGRNDEPIARISERQLAHHAGNAAAVRRKVER